MSFTGVVQDTPAAIRALNESLPVCAPITLKDLKGWEAYMKPEFDPRTWGLTKGVQNRNDCRANAGTTAREVMNWRYRGRKGDLSRMFLYQRCEMLMNKVGQDSGVSVQSGVRVLLDTGCPSEPSYTYDRYTGNRQQLDAWMAPVLAEAADNKIEMASPAPLDFEIAFALVIMGNPIDMASFWPHTMDGNNVVSVYRPRNNMGHAYVAVWGRVMPDGSKQLLVWNSHQNWFFWLTEAAYKGIIERNEFGAYVYFVSSDPIQAHYDFLKNPMIGKRH